MDILSNLYVQIALGVLLLINLVTLIWLWRVSSHYNSLTRGIDKATLQKLLEVIKKNQSSQNKKLTALQNEISWLKDEGKTHLQKLALMRYNPFSDTGGDQSFILGVLNGHGDGLVLTSLHSRENTRLYVKKVKSGKGVEHPLSDDEKEVLSGK